MPIAKHRASGKVVYHVLLTAALIDIIAPACKEPHQWKLFIEYLAKNNRLPNFSQDDEVFLADILERLAIKAKIVEGKLRVDT